MALTKLNFGGKQQALVAANVPTLTGTQMPTGAVLQTKQVSVTDVFSTQSQSYVDITGLTISITPSSASNKILITGALALGSSNYYIYVNLMRDSTEIAHGATASNRPRMWLGTPYFGSSNDDYSLMIYSPNFLDSPNTTSAITYKCQMRTYDGSAYGYLNRSHQDRDNANYEPRGRSNLTVQEIKG